MKYLVLLLVLLVVVGLLRAASARRRAPPAAPAPARRASGPQPMVRCAHCGLHLPQADAVAVQQLHYCSTEHQRAATPR